MLVEGPAPPFLDEEDFEEDFFLDEEGGGGEGDGGEAGGVVLSEDQSVRSQNSYSLAMTEEEEERYCL